MGKFVVHVFCVLLWSFTGHAQSDSSLMLPRKTWLSVEVGKAGLTNLTDRFQGFSLRGHLVHELRPWVAITGGVSVVQAHSNADFLVEVAVPGLPPAQSLFSDYSQGMYANAELGIRLRLIKIKRFHLYALGGGLFSIGSSINQADSYTISNRDASRNFVVIRNSSEFQAVPGTVNVPGNGHSSGVGYWFQAQTLVDLSPNCRLSASGLFQNSNPANMTAPSLNLGIQFRLK